MFTGLKVDCTWSTAAAATATVTPKCATPKLESVL